MNTPSSSGCRLTTGARGGCPLVAAFGDIHRQPWRVMTSKPPRRCKATQVHQAQGGGAWFLNSTVTVIAIHVLTLSAIGEQSGTEGTRQGSGHRVAAQPWRALNADHPAVASKQCKQYGSARSPAMPGLFRTTG